MSAPDRRAMVERPSEDLSVRRDARLWAWRARGSTDDLALMRRIDELHLETARGE